MIFLVRHGQTEFNTERRLQGHADSPLTGLGRAQARANAELLADLIAQDPGPWRLIASPLGRTLATAEIVAARLGLPIELDPRLMEVSWGAWDGRLRSELEREHPDAFAEGAAWAFHAPGGESYEAARARLSDWLANLVAEPARRVIAVSHGFAGRILRGVYAGLSRQATLDQDVPQDAVFRLTQGQIHRFACAPAAEV